MAAEIIKEGYWEMDEEEHYEYYVPNLYQCHCGEKFYGYGDRECTCGSLYNSAGQELRTLSYDDEYGCFDYEEDLLYDY